MTVWAAAPGFTRWGELPGGRPLLIADRASYRPGETASLLLAMPFAQASALVSYGEAGGLASQARDIRAGEPFTLTLPVGAAADVPVAVLLAPRASASGGAASAPPSPLLVETTLPVTGDHRALTVSIAANQDVYAPRSTATLTITTADASGAGVPADVLLSVVGATGVPLGDIGEAFRATPSLLTTVPAPDDMGVAGRPAPVGGTPPAWYGAGAGPASGAYWNPLLRTGLDGVLTLTLSLPDAPADLRALAWAAGSDRFGQAEGSLVVTRPLLLAVEAPPELRAGDEVEVVARVENTSPVSREVEVSLSAAGVEVRVDVAATRRVVLAPGGRARVTWRARVLDISAARLGVTARSPGEAPLIRQIQRPILPLGPQLSQGSRPGDANIPLLIEYLDPRTGQPLDLAGLRAGQLVRARLTAVVTERQPSVTVDVPLPAGAVLLGPVLGGDFEGAGAADGRLSLARGASSVGIYQHSYLLRLVAAGEYGVPAPIARTPGGAAGAGNAVTIVVSPVL
jgi:uncharacterized protein YfaS (alpha-2-macroglobulin family)